MNYPLTTIDKTETDKFACLAKDWWDSEGPLKTLHHINPVRLQFIQNHFLLKDKKILDVGCGGGILTEALVKEGALVQGIDADPSVIKAAIFHAKEMNLAIDYQAVPIEDFHDAHFDAIVCMELLEHIPNPEAFIKKAATLLKPGGYFFVSTLNRTLEAYCKAIVAAEYLLNLLPRGTHDYQKFIKPSELLTAAQLSNLRLVALEGMAYNPFTKRASLTKNVSVNYLMAFVLE